MKTIIKNTCILLAITLVTGLALACVYEITKEPIAFAQEKAKLEAYDKVLPGTKGFTECTTDIASFVPDNGVTVDDVVEGYGDDGRRAGWGITLTSPKGYGGDVTVVIGVNVEGVLTGMTVIEMSETPGLGAKCTGEAFQSQFSGIASESIVYTKSGKSADNEIDAISGATYTTRAIVDAVNAGLKLVYEKLITEVTK